MLALITTTTTFSYGEDLRIGATSMKIGKNCSLVIKNDLSVKTKAAVWNEGDVYFNNIRQATLNLDTCLNGTGTWYINGTADYYIQGDEAEVAFLDIESEYTVFVTDNFSISGALTLGSGIISVTDGVALKITDTAPDAIVFTDNYNNESFIEGQLTRNTTKEDTYTFPMGSETKGFHPVKISQLSSAGYLSVNYQPDYTDNWLPEDHNNVSLEETGAWKISSDDNELTFQPCLSLYTTSGLMDSLYNLFYTSNPDDASPDFMLDYNSFKDTSSNYLTSKTDYQAGLFAISTIENKNNEEEDEIPGLVNFLPKNGTGRSTFEVPGLEEYSKASLLVFNRFGNKVYESHNYANDFNAKNFRRGTYFYVLKLETAKGEKIQKQDIIEILEY